ncbi:MAG: cell wall-binding repeat-containing protein [Firmicutes bacterium]|nr:cell wall-binding repeat-containing protein [Bacillota bacterium]
MKKFSRITALLMILCLLFTTAAFAAGGEGAGGTAPAERPDNRWDRGCREMPFAPGTEFSLVTLDEVAWNSGEYSGKPSAEKAPSAMPDLKTPKEIPLLVLVLGFDNIDYQNGLDWASQIFEGKDSLAQYYKDMSFNQFAFVPAKETSAYGVGDNTNTKDKANDGVVHIKTGCDHGKWAGDDDAEMKAYVGCLVDAVKKADEYVDFASFDADGNGELTNDEFALAVVVAGYEGAYDADCSYGEEYYLWSFAWNIASGWYYYYSEEYPGEQGMYDFIPAPDGVYVNDYITIPELLIPGYQEPISVLAHELGHYLGLPDLYTTDYDYEALWGAYDVGYLSVMCSGSWGWDKSIGYYRPVAFDAWSRSCLGWVEPETVTEGTYDVTSDKGTYNVLRVETGVEGDYYLLENREFTGWDAGLDMGANDVDWSGYWYATYVDHGGLVCWHIDDSVYDEYADKNEVNNTYHRPAVMPLYPEETPTGLATFAGVIDFFDGTAQPFLTYDLWQKKYSKDLGSLLIFPTYNGSDDFDARTLSGANMEILEPSGEHTVTVRFGEEIGLDRYAGSNRYQTAIKASDAYLKKTGAESFDTVIIASGLDYADALAGSYLAVVKNAPILLVNDGMAPAIAEYVDGVLAPEGTIYILGGTGAVSEKAEAALAALGKGTIKRLAGANRYGTNIAILEEAGYQGKDMLVCYGRNYADSLSASAVGRPIFLTGASLNDEQKAFLTGHAKDFSNICVIGGPAVVSEELAKEIADYKDGTFSRVWGANRYVTSVAVAQSFFGADIDKVYLAYAQNYPDGLAGGPVAYLDGAPLILVTNDKYQDAQEYVTGKAVVKCAVMGGQALISDKIALAIMGK